MMAAERIEKLRVEMRREGIDCYVVPSADFHQSEYVGDYFHAREYLTGFTGSAGTAVITAEEAVLFTDGRYFIQAEKELKGTSIQLMKMGEPGVPTLKEYVRKMLPDQGVLGFDGRVISMEDGCEYEKMVTAKGGAIRYESDLIDRIWTNRPSLSKEPAFELDVCYAGESVEEKLARVRKEMEKVGADWHVLTTLDDIGWLLNLRGNDIAFFPMVLAYALISMREVRLYIDSDKLGEDLKARLARAGVRFFAYEEIYREIGQLTDATLLLDRARMNYALYREIPDSVAVVEAANPEVMFKCRKNSVEVANIRKAQMKDSVCHIRFMKWLKEHVGTERITEISASEKLDEFRREQEHFIRPSFDPIAAAGEHGAIVHYSATEETNKELKPGMLFLTDTGAGFYEGSTDITRTYALGEIPQEMKEDFTLVAISNLSLANAKFLEGCTGVNLDILARKPFWDRGRDFKHGTGHGVGYLLNIHEGPIAFRWRGVPGEMPAFEEGMVITDEPGIYIEGSHGIRLENELLVRKGEQNEYGQFLYFEPLTLVPMDLDAIVPEMMSEDEKRMLNAYHKKVYEEISPYLSEEERVWLREYTREI